MRLKLIFFFTLLIPIASTYSDYLSDPAHNSRNSLDWEGTYRGFTRFQGESSPKELIVQLYYDMTYGLEIVGDDTVRYQSSGNFEWDDLGGGVHLLSNDSTVHSLRFLVGENRLFFLDSTGVGKLGGGDLQKVLPD